jgi:hypothetical protein
MDAVLESERLDQSAGRSQSWSFAAGDRQMGVTTVQARHGADSILVALVRRELGDHQQEPVGRAEAQFVPDLRDLLE